MADSQSRRILLLSAYDAGSHRRWREQLAEHLKEHSWTVLSLPPRNFAWRNRGNALSWALGSREVLTDNYDCLLATSMTDLSALKGMAPGLASLPSIVYYHENQFAYPERFERKGGQNYMITNLYTALAADIAVFNSRYNRDSFLDGVEKLLDMVPDFIPAGVVDELKSRSVVVPVPLEAHCYADHDSPSSDVPLTIVWNHRWEYDKAPERFFDALYDVSRRNGNFRLHVLGERFRECPEVFEEAKDKLSKHIDTWGFVEDAVEYRRILTTSDVVISTSLHEFQGVALLEAVAAGCVPLVPDRLAYMEYLPDSFRFPSYPEDPAAESAELSRRLLEMIQDPESVRALTPPDVSDLSWNNLAGEYRNIIDQVVGRSRIQGPKSKIDVK
ncbi:MAG: DUF3524 domain-containing protein [bacterium]